MQIVVYINTNKDHLHGQKWNSRKIDVRNIRSFAIKYEVTELGISAGHTLVFTAVKLFLLLNAGKIQTLWRCNFLFADFLNVNWQTNELCMSFPYLLVSLLFVIFSLPPFLNRESRLVMSLCCASVGARARACVFTSPLSVTFCLCTSFFVPPFQILNKINDIPQSVQFYAKAIFSNFLHLVTIKWQTHEFDWSGISTIYI